MSIKPFVKSEFTKAIMQLKGCSAECFLNDGSSFIGRLYYYNPHTGEYYFIKEEKIYIINHYNCLKIIIEP